MATLCKNKYDAFVLEKKKKEQKRREKALERLQEKINQEQPWTEHQQ